MSAPEEKGVLSVKRSEQVWVKKALQTFVELYEDSKHVTLSHSIDKEHFKLVQEVRSSMQAVCISYQPCPHSPSDLNYNIKHSEVSATSARGMELLLCGMTVRNIADNAGQDDWDTLKVHAIHC